MQRRTKIVATIGPASRDPEVLARMVEAGMDVARLNFSHGSAEEHAETARLVREAAGRAGRQVAILQDLPGPKLRIGPLAEDAVELKTGDRVTFECGDGDRAGTALRMSVSWAGLAAAVEPGEVLYLADGSVRLRVRAVRVGESEVEAESGAVEELELPDSTPPVTEPAELDPEEPKVSPDAEVAPLEEVPAGIPVEPEEESS